MSVLARRYFFWIALKFGLLGLYILRTVMAVIRQVEGLSWIIVINQRPADFDWPAAGIGDRVV